MSRLYEKVENNNFFEIDEERAVDLIKGGNGHFVFNGIYMDLLEENKQLKDNWNKLKEYIKETKLKEFEKSYGKRYGKTFTQAEIIVCNMILDKMQELQGSNSNE